MFVYKFRGKCFHINLTIYIENTFPGTQHNSVSLSVSHTSHAHVLYLFYYKILLFVEILLLLLLYTKNNRSVQYDFI